MFLSGDDEERKLIESLRDLGLDVSPPSNYVAGKRIITASGTWLDWTRALVEHFRLEKETWDRLVERLQAEKIDLRGFEAVFPEFVARLEQERARIQGELDMSVPPKTRA